MGNQNDDSESVTAILPPGLAEDFAEYQNSRGLSKSAAGRELIEAGIEHKDRRAQIFERAATVSIAVLIAAGFVTIAATLVLWAAAFTGALTGVSDEVVFTLGAGTLGIVALGLVIAWVVARRRFFAWADKRFERAARALEVKL